jgi:hypothetical protein
MVTSSLFLREIVYVGDSYSLETPSLIPKFWEGDSVLAILCRVLSPTLGFSLHHPQTENSFKN